MLSIKAYSTQPQIAWHDIVKNKAFIKSQLTKLFYVLLCLCAIILIGWFFKSLAVQNNINHVEEIHKNRAKFYNTYIAHEIDKLRQFSILMSESEIIQSAFGEEANDTTLMEANRFLSETSRKLGAQSIYVMDENGLTILDSNYDKDKNFIGRNYAFRPYFQNAIKSRQGEFLAIGITSNELGYYISSAIPGNKNKPKGVLVIKVDIGLLQKFTKDIEGDFIFSNESKVIFFSSQDKFLLKTLSPLSPQQKLYISRTKQFPLTRISPLDYSLQNVISPDLEYYKIGDDNYFISKVSINNLGWNLWILTDAKPFNNKALAEGLGISTIVFLCLVVFLLFYQKRKSSNRFQFIADHLNTGVIFVNNNLQIVMCNKKFKELMGFPKEMFINGMPSLDDIIRYNTSRKEYSDSQSHHTLTQFINNIQARQDVTIERKRPNGQIVEIQSRWISDGMIATFRDISEQKAAELAAKRNAKYLQNVLQNLDQGISVLDENLNVIFYNNSFFKLLDLPETMKRDHLPYEEIIRYNALRGDYGPGNPDQHIAIRLKAAGKFSPHNIEKTRPDGRTIQVIGKPMKMDGVTIGFISTYHDVTEHQDITNRLKKLSTIDPLTELHNRKSFLNLLEHEIARSKVNSNPLAIVKVSLTKFLSIHNEFGSDISDLFIKEFAEISKNIIQDVHMIGRMNNDQFGFILSECDRQGAIDFVERLIREVRQINVPLGTDLQIPIAINCGIALYNEELDFNGQEFLSRCLQALHRADYKGENEYSF